MGNEKIFCGWLGVGLEVDVLLMCDGIGRVLDDFIGVGFVIDIFEGSG